jgi:hypothetical protein
MGLRLESRDDGMQLGLERSNEGSHSPFAPPLDHFLCIQSPQVYEAVFSMYTRDFKRAASLFLDSIATFTT